MNPFIQVLHFLVSTLFDLYVFALILRFVFQIFRADFYNPLSQFILKVTNPLLIPLRRWIPGYGGVDVSCLLTCVVLSMVKLAILFWLQVQRVPDPLGLLVWSFGDLFKRTIYLFFFAILIQAVLSWINPYGNHPLQGILGKLTNPVVQPFRRIIPPVGGFDITPLFAIVLLQVLIILIAAPIAQVGMSLALR